MIGLSDELQKQLSERYIERETRRSRCPMTCRSTRDTIASGSGLAGRIRSSRAVAMHLRCWWLLAVTTIERVPDQ
jgi:hypothetical protein